MSFPLFSSGTAQSSTLAGAGGFGRGPRGKFAGALKAGVPALCVIAASIALALAFSIPMGEASLGLTSEGGLIENLTLALYALVLVAAVIMHPRGYRAAGLVGLMAVLMALREVDAHKAFTTYGVFKTRLYVSPDVPLSEKIFAALAVIALVVMMVQALRAAWGYLRHRAPQAGVTLLVLCGFVVFLKEVDGLPRVLKKMDMALTPEVLAISKAVEETGEMGLPLLLGLALYQMFKSKSAFLG